MNSKRFVTIAGFRRMTGLSYQTIKNALETRQLVGIKTEAGSWKIDTHAQDNKNATTVLAHLDEQRELLLALCGHLGIKAKVQT